ncbi:MAG: protein-L-isoaspartate O-methyltransferase [Pseudomonadota bacterium]
MSDNPATFDTARRIMVASQLRPQGVTDPLVLAAMSTVPRQDHVPAGARAAAYGDRPLRLGDGSPMMPPAELGLLLTRLAPKPGERALVVGGGGSYAAALLRHIGLDVDSVEASASLVDLILIEGAIEHLPKDLVDRLTSRGRVGTAIVEGGVTRLAIGRVADSSNGKTVGFISFAEAQVPVLPGTSRAPAFAF